jgi:PadR family transcriptional regulator, regulatory protein AphA
MSANRSQYAVLGLLAGGPRTGYEVAKEISTVLSHFWHESDGQIYPVLHRLAVAGLAEREDEPHSTGRRRVLYQITPDGQEALADWLGQPVQPLPPRHEVLLKLFFGRHARPGDLRAMLTGYRTRTQEALAHLESLKAALTAQRDNEPDAAYWLLSVEFGVATLRAISGWCDSSLGTLDSLENRHP